MIKDTTPLLKYPSSLHLAIEQLAEPHLKKDITAVAGIEACGFIFGSLLVVRLGGKVIACPLLIELTVLTGRERLGPHPIDA